MRVRWMRRGIGAATAVALLAVGALGDEPPAPDEAEVEDALAEPVDPDAAADLQADEDPDDVGQEALEPDAQLPDDGPD